MNNEMRDDEVCEKLLNDLSESTISDIIRS